jgi:hypothetical protein
MRLLSLATESSHFVCKYRTDSPIMYDCLETFWISLQWPPGSSDLTPCNSSLWSMVNTKMYMTDFHNINGVKKTKDPCSRPQNSLAHMCSDYGNHTHTVPNIPDVRSGHTKTCQCSWDAYVANMNHINQIWHAIRVVTNLWITIHNATYWLWKPFHSTYKKTNSRN